MGRGRSWLPALALVDAALGWTLLMAMLAVRWPSGVWVVGVVVAVATIVGILGVVAGRRLLDDRETRERLRDAVLTGALTTAGASTIYVAAVLVVSGRPTGDEVDAARAAALGALLAGAALIPLASRLGRWTRRVLPDVGRPRRELLEQFGRRLAGSVPVRDTLEQLVDDLRPASAAATAEVWLWRESVLTLATASPSRRAAPIAVDADRGALIGRAGVSGDRWVDEWLPGVRTGPGPLRLAPLAVQGALFGVVVIQRTEGADDFDDGDDEALARVARLVAALLQSAELDDELRRTVDDLRRTNSELRSSRARLVSVADEERRRLERDLHDGAQSQLASVAVHVQLTKALLASEPESVPGLLDEIDRELRDASSALRSLAHGIFPTLLLTGGLVDALAGVAATSAADVTIGRVTARRFERDVETAVYFCCAEAVHNAAKHAGACAHVTLDVGVTDAELWFTVSDDGAGFEFSSAHRGHGFTNMADRLGALSGTLDVTSSPGEGTTVRGTVPISATAG